MEIQTDASIHETVEEIISEKVSNHDEGAQARMTRIVDAQPEKEERKQTKDTVSSPTSDLKTQGQIPSRQVEQVDRGLSAVKTEKPLPEIVVTASAGTEGSRGKEKLVDSEKQDETEPSRSTTEKEKEVREKRKEEERLARKAERARWRKSEQEFSQLPHAPMAVTLSDVSPRRRMSEERSRQAVTLRSSSPPYILPGAQAPIPIPPTSPVHDEEKDRELALELQARLAKEIEEEDERKALEIGIELHRQWEAEQDRDSDSSIEVTRGTLVSVDGPASSSYKPERRKAFQASEAKPRIVYSDIS